MNRPPRADFGFRVIRMHLTHLSETAVLVIDNNTGGPSVAHDLEAVVASIRLALGPDQADARIFYKRGEHHWDELVDVGEGIIGHVPAPKGGDFDKAWRYSEPYPMAQE